MTPELTDSLIESVCLSQDELAYQRVLMTFGKQSNIHPSRCIERMDIFIRRRVVRRTEYLPPDHPRPSRENLPWTWGELRILRWAISLDCERGGESTPDYLAQMLRRTAKEIADQILRLQTEKEGIVRFEL